MLDETSRCYRTSGGIEVLRHIIPIEYEDAVEPVIEALESQRGVLLSSGYEYPGRYQRWDVGFVNPPLVVTTRRRQLCVTALNERGRVLLPVIAAHLREQASVQGLETVGPELQVRIRAPLPVRYEEDRSHQHGVFPILRSLVSLFHDAQEKHLGLYGAFGYDLAFQFDAIHERLPRDPQQRDLVLYLPDELVVVDHRRNLACRHRYDFFVGERNTLNLSRTGASRPFRLPDSGLAEHCDHAPGDYADTVCRALEGFQRGDLFEAVPGQQFDIACRDAPGAIFRRLRQANPAPYGVFMNLGEAEYLVGASPEMFVRVRGREVETCPISGTIARGRDAQEDAGQILKLLNSAKDHAELSMCTDVDRNDKARVCVPGSVRIVGRRQIEMYSRLIHTVDHVRGTLSPDRDALDAFLSHAWAVTVTGAPKAAAMQFIEDHERSQRRWYGGAMGCIGFNGDLNTGLTLRTMRIRDGVAEVRAGATLLCDSDPEAEERETRLKASALLDAIRNRQPSAVQEATTGAGQAAGTAMRVLMVDHRDSFVHSLVAYFRIPGCEVRTVRHDQVPAALREFRPSLMVLSPGPGKPGAFAMSATIDQALQGGIAVFGVCLGLQGIVEYFGGSLRQLDRPVHGRASRLRTVAGEPLFSGLPVAPEVGRYHSLVADRLPDCLRVTATTDDGEIMGVRHASLPVSGVQFHPESLLSMAGEAGQRLIANLLAERFRGCASDSRPGMELSG